MSDFENRLRKNAKHRQKWAQRQGLTAYRVYDLDMPEWPYAVDRYGEFVHVMEYARSRALKSGQAAEARVEVLRACAAVFEVGPEKVFTKTHERHVWGREQYEAVSSKGVLAKVVEYGLTFECNLSDYLDTGLFLDHRETRAEVGRSLKGQRFLNLFAYTGAFTVHARKGGATETTTVDLSHTYCDWAERNFALNGFATSPQHQVVRDDVLAWLEHTRNGPYDVVVLDPPSFSTSKKMSGRFDVQKDHGRVIERVLELLAPGGTLYFSTNFLGFEPGVQLAHAEEMTEKLRPDDFRRTVQRSWRLTRR